MKVDITKNNGFRIGRVCQNIEGVLNSLLVITKHLEDEGVIEQLVDEVKGNLFKIEQMAWGQYTCGMELSPAQILELLDRKMEEQRAETEFDCQAAVFGENDND